MSMTVSNRGSSEWSCVAMRTAAPLVRPASISRSIERLSSGLRINRGADDAAGLAVSESMRSQIRGMNVASRNAQDGVSMVQVADGALGTVGDMLQRVRDLAVQASNGTLTDAQRSNLDVEVQQILAEVGKTGTDTEFNGLKILAGSVATAASAVTLQVGANASQSIAFTIGTVSESDLGISGIARDPAAAAPGRGRPGRGQRRSGHCRPVRCRGTPDRRRRPGRRCRLRHLAHRPGCSKYRGGASAVN